MLENDDLDGYQVWKDVLKIIEWMRDGKIEL